MNLVAYIIKTLIIFKRILIIKIKKIMMIINKTNKILIKIIPQIKLHNNQHLKKLKIINTKNKRKLQFMFGYNIY